MWSAVQLTTSRQEDQVSGEQAGGGADGWAVQEVDHVTDRVTRSEKSFEVHPTDFYRVFVREGAEKTGHFTNPSVYLQFLTS